MKQNNRKPMTKRGYKAILRAIIRANFWKLNPAACYMYGSCDLDITLHRVRVLPREFRTCKEYEARQKRLCEAVADFWPYRRAFVDKLAALFADREQFCDHSYANDVILVKYALSVGRCRYADLVEETTGEKFANERERGRLGEEPPAAARALGSCDLEELAAVLDRLKARE